MEDRARPKRYETETQLLDMDEVIRHVNYLNSPLGFFDYFRTGQKLKYPLKFGAPIFDYSVQTKDDELVFQAVVAEGELALFTYQRTYSPDMSYTEKYYVHTDVNWTTVKNVLATEDAGEINIFDMTAEKQSMALVGFFRARMNGPIHDQSFYNEYMERRSTVVETIQRDLDSLIQEMHESGRPQSEITDEHGEGIKEVRDDLAYDKSMLQQLESMNETDRIFYIDSIHYKADFSSRKIRPSRPYFKFGPSEDPVPTIRSYIDARKQHLMPKFEEMIHGNVFSAILDQYREAVEVKKLVTAN